MTTETAPTPRRFKVGDRVTFSLYGINTRKRIAGVVTEVDAKNSIGDDWDYKVLFDDPAFRPPSDSGNALVLENELEAEAA